MRDEKLTLKHVNYKQLALVVECHLRIDWRLCQVVGLESPHGPTESPPIRPSLRVSAVSVIILLFGPDTINWPSLIHYSWLPELLMLLIFVRMLKPNLVGGAAQSSLVGGVV